MQVLQVQLEVGPDPAEVGRARRWARSRLVGSGIRDDEPLAETLILLISELVTNAVVHTGCPAVLRMLFGTAETAGTAGTVRVEVADTSCRPPQQRHAAGEDTGGRGLELVDGLADRWGWQPEGAGKRIWCEVDRGAPVIQVVPVHPVVQSVQGVHGAPGAADADREAYEPSRVITHRA
ncbi:ATP-binding protein [Streptomyces atratus]|uniref:ATP-binding protein n=1 Tax=Streptomyces atratus TaxID=1893 RepID=UPI0019CDC2AF|nr:ATP-binding protein [Streptomyces atratus]WPW30572.1 ATP-binding protein [Streptomyces atratus]GGT14557.1 ATP-binding protein [Streptomyces atratus]